MFPALALTSLQQPSENIHFERFQDGFAFAFHFALQIRPRQNLVRMSSTVWPSDRPPHQPCCQGSKETLILAERHRPPSSCRGDHYETVDSGFRERVTLI